MKTYKWIRIWKETHERLDKKRKERGRSFIQDIDDRSKLANSIVDIKWKSNEKEK